jgi:hypothetical protein
MTVVTFSNQMLYTVTVHPDGAPLLTVRAGAQNILRAFTADVPEDLQQIFLTSWGEWWPKDVYGVSLDKALQDKWSPSKDQVEVEEGLAKGRTTVAMKNAR